MSQNRSILVVDDDHDCRTMVKTILSSSGFEVEICASGPEALARLNSYTPALVILDIMMPEMSGYDVVVHMKQRLETQNIPIMMLSAKGEPDDLLVGYKDYGVEY